MPAITSVHAATPSPPFCCCFKLNHAALYAFIVKALSLRDAGGLVRMAGYWQTEEDGWQFECQFFTLLVLSGVERTIVF
jgi:hypothetical protein